MSCSNADLSKSRTLYKFATLALSMERMEKWGGGQQVATPLTPGKGAISKTD